MEHKTNQSLISLLQDRRQYFLNFAMKYCKNREIAEDIIQSVLCKLLRIPVTQDIESSKQYLIKMIVRMYQNYKKVNAKYIMVGDLHTQDKSDSGIILELLAQKNTTCTYVGDMMDSFTLKEVREAAKILPSLQRESIHAALSGRDIADDVGGPKKYNTLKANRRHAIVKLREKFKQEDK